MSRLPGPLGSVAANVSIASMGVASNLTSSVTSNISHLSSSLTNATSNVTSAITSVTLNVSSGINSVAANISGSTGMPADVPPPQAYDVASQDPNSYCMAIVRVGRGDVFVRRTAGEVESVFGSFYGDDTQKSRWGLRRERERGREGERESKSKGEKRE